MSNEENNLKADHSYIVGDFQIILNEETGDLKVLVHKSRLSLVIKPNTDNSCTLSARNESKPR